MAREEGKYILPNAREGADVVVVVSGEAVGVVFDTTGDGGFATKEGATVGPGIVGAPVFVVDGLFKDEGDDEVGFTDGL